MTKAKYTLTKINILITGITAIFTQLQLEDFFILENVAQIEFWFYLNFIFFLKLR